MTLICVCKRGFVALAALGIGLLAFAGDANAVDFDRVVKIILAKNTREAKAQRRIDEIDSKTRKLLDDYREKQRTIEGLLVYNHQVRRLVAAQKEKILDLERQITDAAQVAREITPLMLRMVSSLEAFIKLDIPFLLQERHERVAALRDMINHAEIADSEKFRRVLEAYQIENDYGRNVEAYSTRIELKKGDPRTVDLLRIGRIALVYRSADGRSFGFWNKSAKRWDPLPKRFSSPAAKGFRIARKQTAGDLIRLPVLAATEVGE